LLFAAIPSDAYAKTNSERSGDTGVTRLPWLAPINIISLFKLLAEGSMESTSIAETAENFASQVARNMEGFRANLGPKQSLYVYALVVPDDFASVMAYANTSEHLATRKGGPLDTWYFGQWFIQGIQLETDVLSNVLGDADFNDDRETQNRHQAAWILALATGLRLAGNRGALDFRGRRVAAFCSMIDSRNAVWIERETARIVNSPELFATFEKDLAAAAADWYRSNQPDSNGMRVAFDHLWQRCQRDGGL
jgi:hypothetical protein